MRTRAGASALRVRNGALPSAAPELPFTVRESAAAVYLPSCVNRIVGSSPGTPARPSLPYALVAISQGLLNSAVRGLQAGDCSAASHDALDSINVLSARPEPYQVLGFCDSRAGENELAIQLLQTAVDRDPDEWESYYGLALVKGAAGEDPRPAAAKAYELAPHEPLAEEAVRIFNTSDPEKWRRRALQARLPIL